jgi:hypothetical protein
VVTYISRQANGRRLRSEAHESLLEALGELEDEGICEVRVAEMQGMTLAEQIEVASSSTVRAFVHLNQARGKLT